MQADSNAMLIIESNDECMEYLPKKYRYIRCHVNWNSVNQSNHFVELEAYYNWTNVALNKTVTVAAWTVHSTSPKQPAAFVDWDKTSNNYCDWTANASVWFTLQVDLGQAYELNYLKLWHYYSDWRSYNDNIVTASRNWTKRDTLFNSNVSWTYRETSSWKTINIQ